VWCVWGVFNIFISSMLHYHVGGVIVCVWVSVILCVGVILCVCVCG